MRGPLPQVAEQWQQIEPNPALSDLSTIPLPAVVFCFFQTRAAGFSPGIFSFDANVNYCFGDV